MLTRYQIRGAESGVALCSQDGPIPGPRILHQIICRLGRNIQYDETDSKQIWNFIQTFVSYLASNRQSELW